MSTSFLCFDIRLSTAAVWTWVFFHDTLQFGAQPLDGPFLDCRRRHGWMVDNVPGFDKGFVDNDGVGITAFRETLQFLASTVDKQSLEVDNANA